MPFVDRKFISPEDAHATGHCPECGDALAGINIEAHIHTHWPHLDPQDPNHAEANRRAQLLREFAKTEQAKSTEQKGA